MIRRSAIAAVLAIAAVTPRIAAADDDPVELARALVDQGQHYFDLGQYAEAIAVFREAYRLDPRPGVLFNIGQAYRLIGDCVNSSLMYRNFLRLDPKSRHRPLAEQHLASLAACEQEQLAADVKPQPLDEPAPVEPPPAPTVEPEPAPAPVPVVDGALPAPVAARGGALRSAGLITAAAGGVALAAGAYFAVDAAHASREVSEAYRQGGAWADVEAIDERGRRSETIGTALLVTGGAAVVTGATLYVLGRRAGRSAAVIPHDGGGEVVVTWAF
jgi:tetratricopeptide (TPR) repeat protein